MCLLGWLKGLRFGFNLCSKLYLTDQGAGLACGFDRIARQEIAGKIFEALLPISTTARL